MRQPLGGAAGMDIRQDMAAEQNEWKSVRGR